MGIPSEAGTDADSWSRDDAGADLEHGLCTEYPGVDWFDPRDTAAAVAICRRCSVATECGSYARQNGEAAGVWAGVALDPRRRPQRARARTVSDGTPARLREVEVVPPTPSPPPVRARTWPRNDGPAPPAPASCARCPMPVGKGKTLCKECERAAG